MTSAQILIVEDEAVVAEELRQRLTLLGLTVVAVVSSGEEAVEVARQLRPNVVLMDIRLQGELDGIEAASRIRAELKVPIVYLTAYSDEATVARARATEPSGYLL